MDIYETIKQLTLSFPNNMELGAHIRNLVNSIEEKKQSDLREVIDPRQMNIYDVINEEDAN